MTFNKQHLFIGGAAVILLGAGVTAGSVLFGGDRSHTGETLEQHAAELSASGDDSQGEEAEHAGEAGEHADTDEHAEEAGEHAEEREVHMAAEVVQQSGIALETLSPSSLVEEIVAQATVVSSPQGEAILTARAAGSISAIRKQLGDPVSRGETVAVVASAEAAGLAAARSAARARYDQAKLAFEREKRLFEQNVTARQDFEAAQAELSSAEAEFRRSDAAAKAAHVSADGASVYISSPIAGRITEVTPQARLGAYVTPDAILFRIADPSKIQIEAAVPLTEAGRISVGDAATIEPPSGGSVAATVRSVAPSGTAENRTASVVLSIDAGAGAGTLQPGRFARVVIRPKTGGGADGQFVLPDEAVQTIEGQPVVFVRSEEGFEAVSVRTGARSGGRTEVLSGLSPGQVVATRNAFLLKAELGKGSAEHEH